MSSRGDRSCYLYLDRDWGYQLHRDAALKGGSLYPILDRLEREEWITGEWEEPGVAAGQPPRRYYRLTGAGETAAREALVSRRVLGWGPAL
jgi:PadR family transcriptional regulator PadR